MRKDKLLKEWFEFNTKYWKALKLRAKLHGHLQVHKTYAIRVLTLGNMIQTK